jgi:pimeloyl-ACP methyl ester carboxylesterase
MESVRPLAGRLASKYRVIIYDSRNRGASGVNMGEGSDLENRAVDLHALLNRLGATPAYVGVGSVGCAVSVLLAVRHPETVKGFLLWSVAVGSLTAEQTHGFFGQYIDMALRDGMKRVIESKCYAERMSAVFLPFLAKLETTEVSVP